MLLIFLWALRFESVKLQLDYAALAADQENYAELKALLAKETSMQFEKVRILWYGTQTQPH